MSRKIKWFDNLRIEKKLLDEINIDAIINDFASLNVRRKFKGKMYNLFDKNAFFSNTLIRSDIISLELY